MSTQPLTESLSDEQLDDLCSLLNKVENARTARDAVWLDRKGREKIREIRETIENSR